MFRGGGGWLDRFSFWLSHCMGFTCQVVRGSSAFTPCLEHVRAGGGGSVANALFSCHEGVGYCIFHLDHSVLVQSDICHLRCHRDMWVYVWRTC